MQVVKKCKFFFTVVTLIVSGFSSFSQGRIAGRVYDASAQEVLPFANVYVNNTTIGTNADEDGNFVLSNIPIGENHLIVSYVGHQNFEKRIVINDTVTIAMDVRLIPLKMKEIEVRATRDKQWDKQLQKFRRLFLGPVGREDQVKIINAYALDFREDDDNFFASCPEVLEIENYLLGYYVSYEMRSFFVTPSAFNIVGNVRFKEMKTTDPQLLKRWKKNREEAYEGSYRHLFKSIIDGSVNRSGFQLYQDIDQRNFQTVDIFNSNLDRTVSKYSIGNELELISDGVYKLALPKRIEVHYKNKSAPPKYYKDVTWPVSWIESSKGNLLLTKEGVVINYSMMTVSGDMSFSRIAELLPIDYKPSELPQEKTISKVAVNSYRDLIEKPYLQTDRSCYYAGDVIWFKAYMNYSNPLLKDSLSHVLYVDLMSPQNRIVSRRIIKLARGTGEGEFELPQNFVHGDYYLRAYTQWMLNFSSRLIFARPIKVLPFNQYVGRNKFVLDSTTVGHQLKITAAKKVYSTRERIKLRLHTFDSIGNPLAANLSISVTDLLQTGLPENERNILSDFLIEPQDINPLPTSVRYRLQDGIEIKGKLTKATGEASIINVAEKNSGNISSVSTTHTGEFRIENLNFRDSAEFVLQAKSFKNGTPGEIIVDSISINPVVMAPPHLKIDIVEDHGLKGVRWTPVLSSQAITLQEVVIKANKISDTKTPIEKMANYSISGEWLRATNSRNIIVALQGRIPGLEILTFFDGKSNPFQVVMFQMRQKSFFPGGPGNAEKKDQLKKQEPLIFINDVLVNYELGEGAHHIQMLKPEQIERIDVYRSNAYGNYGSMGNNGVINIYTKNPIEYVDAREEKRVHVQTFKVAGFSTPKEFASPQYNMTDKAFTDDYRATIFWKPSVTIENPDEGASVEFFAADIPTKYRVVVEGVAADGTPVRGEEIIEIETNE